MPTIETTDMELFMQEAEAQLRMFLLIAPRMSGAMSHQRDGLGFGTNVDTFELLTMKQTSFHPVGSSDDHWIVIYTTPAERGFGLYDPNKGKEVCVPIEIRAVLRTWVDEDEHFQRNEINVLIEKLDILKDRSGS
jgi:hypothetical protein